MDDCSLPVKVLRQRNGTRGSLQLAQLMPKHSLPQDDDALNWSLGSGQRSALSTTHELTALVEHHSLWLGQGSRSVCANQSEEA